MLAWRVEFENGGGVYISGNLEVTDAILESSRHPLPREDFEPFENDTTDRMRFAFPSVLALFRWFKPDELMAICSEAPGMCVSVYRVQRFTNRSRKQCTFLITEAERVSCQPIPEFMAAMSRKRSAEFLIRGRAARLLKKPALRRVVAIANRIQENGVTQCPA